MTRLATLIAAIVAALTLTTMPAMADEVVEPVSECDATLSCPTAPEGPTIIGPGAKPQRVFDRDRRRSCKSEAKVFERVTEIRWTLSEDYSGNVIFKSWSPQSFDYGWSRVLPTPYGCRLNHRAWERRQERKAQR